MSEGQAENILRDAADELFKVVVPTPEERTRLAQCALAMGMAIGAGDRKEARRVQDAFNLTVGTLEVRAGREADKQAFRVFTRMLALVVSLI